jgi:hypothetical protein
LDCRKAHLSKKQKNSLLRHVLWAEHCIFISTNEAPCQMRKSDLIELLTVLYTKERKSLRDYLLSPYFVDQKTVEPLLRLFDSTLTFIDKKKDDHSESEMYAIVFPNDDKFIENKLDKLKSELIKHYRKWAIVEVSVAKYPDKLEHIPLSEFFLKKELPNHYRRSHKVLTEWLRQAEMESWLPAQFGYLIQMHETHSTYASTYDYDSLKSAIENHFAAIELHFGFYRLYFTWIYQSYLNVHGLNSGSEQAHIDQLAQWEGLNGFFQTTQGRIIHGLLWLKQNKNVEQKAVTHQIEALMEIFETNRNVLHPYLFRNLATVFHSLIAKEGTFFLGKSWQIQKMLAELTLERIGSIHENNFLGIVHSALTVGEIEWANWFIEAAEKLIVSETDAQGVITYAHAASLFHEGKCEVALDFIVTGHFPAPLLKATVKILEIQILYTLNHDLLDSRLDAAKVFFHREDKLSNTQKNQCNEFLNFMRRLGRNSVDLKLMERNMAILHATTTVAKKEWLVSVYEQRMRKLK